MCTERPFSTGFTFQGGRQEARRADNGAASREPAQVPGGKTGIGVTYFQAPGMTGAARGRGERSEQGVLAGAQYGRGVAPVLRKVLTCEIMYLPRRRDEKTMDYVQRPARS